MRSAACGPKPTESPQVLLHLLGAPRVGRTEFERRQAMHKTMLAMFTLLVAAAAMAGDEGFRGHRGAEPTFRLSGWAEIPSTYRRPGSPVSGQFQVLTPPTLNGVTPPYEGQPIPGFSGVIPSRLPGVYIGLPDNGYGAQGNSADYILGFYHFRPHFKTHGDGT